MTNEDIAKAWFEAIDVGDFESLKKLIDKNHHFHNPMTEKPAGRDQHIELIRNLTSSVTGRHLLDLIISEGEYVAIKGRFKGTHTGKFNNIPATKRPVEFSWIDIFHIVDGKVADEYFEFNPSTILNQISALQQNA